MQHEKHFRTLLLDKVNLPQTKLDQLRGRVDSIYAALRRDSEIGGLITGVIKQGSWAHRTIIRPLPGREYDADILLLMDENPEWSADPRQYIEHLYQALGRVGYPNRSRHTRCVRVQYANDSHVDIVPYVGTTHGRRIVNKRLNDWEDSNPEGFTTWMAERDEITNGNFRRVVRLLKYLRDHKGNFTGTRSIILTTMLGNQADPVVEILNPRAYGTVPHTLVTLTSALDTWMQARLTMPPVVDPSSAGTTFNHRWSEESYQHFRTRIHDLAPKMQEALAENSRERSLSLWQDVFGSGFESEQSEGASKSPFVTGGTSSSSGRSGRAG